MKIQKKTYRYLILFSITYLYVSIAVGKEETVFRSTVAQTPFSLNVFTIPPEILNPNHTQSELLFFQPSPPMTSIEAEGFSSLDNGRILDRYSGFSGQKYVVLKGEGRISWTVNIEDNNAGLYTLMFNYALKNGKRPLDITVQKWPRGVFFIVAPPKVPIQTSMSFPVTGSYSDLKTIAFLADLVAGKNIVTISATGSGAPFFDSFHYTRARFLTEGGDIKPNPNPAKPEVGNSEYKNSYYGKVDPEGRRTTLDDWKNVNGFNDNFSDIINAQYINGFDLGFGRDMFCRPPPFRILIFPDNNKSSDACFVQNFTNPNKDPKLVVTVTMERMNIRINVDGVIEDRTIVAFFAYNAAGNRVNQVALDKEGLKSIPESCYACHSGETDANGNPMGGQFLPFDLTTFKDWKGHPTLNDQAENFRKLNLQMQVAARNKKSIHDLITLWYDKTPYVPHTTFSADAHLPENDWFTDKLKIVVPIVNFPARVEEVHTMEKKVYKEVYAKYCRACHVAQGPTDSSIGQANTNIGRDFLSAKDFLGAVKTSNVCEKDITEGVMPNAELTHKKFWTDIDALGESPQRFLCELALGFLEARYIKDDGTIIKSAGEVEVKTKKAIEAAIKSEDTMKNIKLESNQIQTIADALNGK